MSEYSDYARIIEIFQNVFKQNREELYEFLSRQYEDFLRSANIKVRIVRIN